MKKKKENAKINKHLDVVRELIKKVVEHESGGDTNDSGLTWNSPQKFGKKTGGAGNKGRNRDPPDD